MSDKSALDRWHERDTDERRGTSTSDDEATLRDIGRAAFGIDYPRDVTPKRRLENKSHGLVDFTCKP